MAKWYEEKTPEYWWRMGEIGELIASDVFSADLQAKFGKVLWVVNGHEPLYTKLGRWSVDNFDEEAMHLDLVATLKRVNLKYFIYSIAEVKSTVSANKTEFTLNGMCARYLQMAIRCRIPVYFYIVRFPEPLPDDIVTDDGSVRTFMKYKGVAKVESYGPGEYKMDADKIWVLKPSDKDEADLKDLMESATEGTKDADMEEENPQDDEALLKKLMADAKKEYQDRDP